MNSAKPKLKQKKRETIRTKRAILQKKAVLCPR
jgi:hypothetical protein